MPGARVEDARHWVGGPPGTANGGYCWFFAEVTVRATGFLPEVRSRLDEVARTLPGTPELFTAEVLAARPGDPPDVLVVRAEQMGEGGTLDLRCG